MATKLNSKSCAALIRRMLKDKFPGIKFSVRHSTYAGGSSVDVRYTNGPAYRLVDDLLNPLRGKGFDGMTDCQTYSNHTVEILGEAYEAAYCWISVHRSISEEVRGMAWLEQEVHCGDWPLVHQYERERRVNTFLRTTSFT